MTSGPELFSGTITAAWLHDGETLHAGGGLRIARGRVEKVLDDTRESPEDAGERRLDFPRGLIHPGLLNAHSHLDLSDALPTAHGAPFTEWLEAARALRAGVSPDELRASAARGLEALVGRGVTGVFDFSFDGVSRELLAASPLETIVLRETIGLSGERAAAAISAARAWIERSAPAELHRDGLAPHAPYSAGPEVIRECKRLAGSAPFAIHAAEDPAETEFLLSGGGALRALLERLAVDLRGFTPPARRPIALLDELGALDASTLLIHANDLRKDEIHTIAARDAAVVFCPGTHEFFDRPRHPLLELLGAGVRVALGTDSPASNRTCSVLEEMRAVRRLFPELGAEEIWSLGTGRRLDARRGRLREGTRADLAVLELEAVNDDDAPPLERALSTPRGHVLTIANGVVAAR